MAAPHRCSIVESKTDAGRRTIDIAPLVLTELKLHKVRPRLIIRWSLVRIQAADWFRSGAVAADAG
jgi:hypothetical protein